jgi:hypothetical protein
MKGKTLQILLAALVSLGTLSLQSCSENEGDETVVSVNNGQKSHNMGQNCMNCHKSGGPGEGWFSAAGTVYNDALTATSPNGLVKLYTGPNGTGTLKATVAVDGKGNFFTTESIDFTGGLYPSVTGTSGETEYMDFSITTGACYSCHGSTTDKIYTN